MNIGQIVKMCPGGRHAWYQTSLGYPVRKPLGYDQTKRDLSYESKPEPIHQDPKQLRARHFGFAGYLSNWMAAAMALDKVPFFRMMRHQGKRGK